MKTLHESAVIFTLHDGDELTYGSYLGEIRVDFDSDETAFVTPCNRIEMSDEVEAVLIEKLAPLGVKWMRWWVNGHIVGRSFEEVL
jgi:hypothetical protein